VTVFLAAELALFPCAAPALILGAALALFDAEPAIIGVTPAPDSFRWLAPGVDP
jgi:hypothetical protein